jgi:hypothetical protein
VNQSPGTRKGQPRRRAWVAALAVGLALVVDSFCAPALAYPDGIAADGCGGCHNGGSASGSLALSVAPATFDPGDEVTVELTLSASSVAVGGVYVTTERVGSFRALGGEGLAPTSAGLVHDEPRSASGGEVRFRFAWRAPDSPGAVRFKVFALAADGNGNRSGDSAFSDAFEFVYGCTGQTFYFDGDSDDFGRDTATSLGCAGAPPAGHAAEGGDCDDFDETVHPGAAEICDQEDNDCNQRVDEDAEPVELWPDPDADGYFDEKVGEPVLGCVGLEGYAAEGGDCAPNDPAIHGGAEETCNFIDDNCNGDVDERVKPTCGEGWCRRESTSCSLEHCIPGEPVPESCNYLDDDCDGQLDEGSLCPEGSYCVEGECAGKGEVPGGGGEGDEGEGDEGEGDEGPGAGEDDTETGRGSSSCTFTPARSALQGAWPLALLGIFVARRRAARRGELEAIRLRSAP